MNEKTEDLNEKEDEKPQKNIFDTEEIRIEELAVDGICGVYWWIKPGKKYPFWPYLTPLHLIFLITVSYANGSNTIGVFFPIGCRGLFEEN